ncbi:MAG: sugar phosphate isomerase/epimerase family protein [Candidatus Brocadiia bacterium]
MDVGYMLMGEPRGPDGQAVPWHDFLAEARGWGLESVDLFPAYFERAGEPVAGAAEAIADLGLAVAAYCVRTDLVSPDPAMRQGSLDRVAAGAEQAAELGLGHLFSYGGQHENRGEEALRRYADGLARAADLCALQGLVLSIENAGSLCHTPDELARCLEAADRPNLALTLDPGNFVLAGCEPHQAARRLAARTVHLHVKNFVDDPARRPRPFRYCSPRRGQVDYARVARQLAEAGYEGALAFEPEGFPDAQAEDGIRYLAELLASSDS